MGLSRPGDLRIRVRAERTVLGNGAVGNGLSVLKCDLVAVAGVRRPDKAVRHTGEPAVHQPADHTAVRNDDRVLPLRQNGGKRLQRAVRQAVPALAAGADVVFIIAAAPRAEGRVVLQVRVGLSFEFAEAHLLHAGERAVRPVAVQGGKRLLRAGHAAGKILLRLRIAAAVTQRVQGLDAIRQQRQVHRAIIKPADVALRQAMPNQGQFHFNRSSSPQNIRLTCSARAARPAAPRRAPRASGAPPHRAARHRSQSRVR